jgi:hypothetical protein
MTDPYTGSGVNFIHYNTTRTDYTVSEDELIRLREAGQNLWKDVTLVSFSVGLTCILNAIAGTLDPFSLTFTLFLNYMFGFLGIILTVVFGIFWRKTHKSLSSIINAIQNKPKLKVEVESSSGSTAAPLVHLSNYNQAPTPNP